MNVLQTRDVAVYLSAFTGIELHCLMTKEEEEFIYFPQRAMEMDI